MIKSEKHITVFEHESIRFDKGEKRITEDQFKALQTYYGEGIPFYKLNNNGVCFNEYVGVIQIGETVIEVLPKADNNDFEENIWRDILIGMLRTVNNFEIKATSNSDLKTKPNTILELYYELFIIEIEYLIHNGLIKKYHQKENNVSALKGNLQFAKHLQQNLIHHERFYVKHNVYDVDHTLHFIIYKVIRLLKKINTNSKLSSRIGSLLLHFPEMEDMKVTSVTFDKLNFNRKNYSYKKAIDIAKLLLLQFHPDVRTGRNNVLALMFDMNKLWEQFVQVSIRRYKNEDETIITQNTKLFWEPEIGNQSTIRPDIVFFLNNKWLVLDTKWKNLGGTNPSTEDLRQMYVYHKYYDAKSVALVYPGAEFSRISGFYLDPITESRSEMECSIITIPVNSNIKEWQKSIHNNIKEWFQ